MFRKSFCFLFVVQFFFISVSGIAPVSSDFTISIGLVLREKWPHGNPATVNVIEE